MSDNEFDLADTLNVQPVVGSGENQEGQPNRQDPHLLDGTVSPENVDFIDGLNIDFTAVDEHLQDIRDAEVAIESLKSSGMIGKLTRNALESVLGEFKQPSGAPIQTTLEPSGVNVTAIIESANALVQKNVSDVEAVINSLIARAKEAQSFVAEAQSNYTTASANYMTKQQGLVDKFKLMSLRDLVVEVFPTYVYVFRERIGVYASFEAEAPHVQALAELYNRIARLSLSGNAQDAWNGLVNNCEPLKMGDAIVNPETLVLFDKYEYSYEDRGTYLQLLAAIGTHEHTRRVNVCLSAATNALAIIGAIKTEAKEGQAVTLVDLQAALDCMRHCMSVLMEARAQYNRLCELFTFGCELIDICVAAQDNKDALFAAVESNKRRPAGALHLK